MATKSNRSRRTEKRRSNSIGLWLIVGAVVLVGLVVLLVIRNQTPATISASAYDDYDAAWVNGNVLGDPNATISVQIWDDFL